MSNNWPDSNTFWRDKRVVVTGGSGFLGSFVVDKLRARCAAEGILPSTLLRTGLAASATTRAIPSTLRPGSGQASAARSRPVLSTAEGSASKSCWRPSPA